MAIEAVVIVCGRCGRTVAGTRSPHFTSGFYDTDTGPICEACMSDDDPDNQAKPGPVREAPEVKQARRDREAARLKAQRERIAAARARWLRDHPNDG